MVIILLFTLFPLVLGLVLEYAAFRLTMGETGRHWRARRLLRLVPPLGAVLLIAVVAVSRWQIWQNQEVSPLTQILLIPGVPGLFGLLGLLLGWRLWRRRWSPRVIQREKRGS